MCELSLLTTWALSSTVSFAICTIVAVPLHSLSQHRRKCGLQLQWPSFGCLPTSPAALGGTMLEAGSTPGESHGSTAVPRLAETA
jgi:hypothetical protein